MPAPVRLVERLTRQRDRSGFDCGIQPLNAYLRQQARQDADKHVAAPFVLVEPPSRAVLGYVVRFRHFLLN